MTLKVLKSQIGDRDFASEVAAYRDKIIEYWDLPGEAPPAAPPFVEEAIRREPQADGPDKLVIDYEIIDDTPPPPSKLELKAKAFSESRQREQDEIAAIMPPGKARLHYMDRERAMRVPPANRSPQQLAFLAHCAEIDDQIEQIQYAAAQREAQIEDEEK